MKHLYDLCPEYYTGNYCSQLTDIYLQLYSVEMLVPGTLVFRVFPDNAGYRYSSTV